MDSASAFRLACLQIYLALLHMHSLIKIVAVKYVYILMKETKSIHTYVFPIDVTIHLYTIFLNPYTRYLKLNFQLVDLHTSITPTFTQVATD